MDIFGYNPIVSPIYVEPAFDMSNVTTTSQRQPRAVTGVVDSGDGFTIVQYSDGTTERRAGSRGIRNNNPGNLTGTLQGALRQGAIAVDHGGNYVFPDAQTGQRAMANFVLQRNADSSIGDMLGTYAPAGAANDPNNTNRLYPGMVQGAGFNLGDRVGALPAAEQQRLLDTMMGIETGQPAPARQVATLQTQGRGGLPLQERFANAGIQAPTFGGVMGALGNATVGPIMESGSDLLGAVGNMGRAAGDFLSNPSMENLTRGTGETARRNAAALGGGGDAGTDNSMFRQLGTPGDQLRTDAQLAGMSSGRGDGALETERRRTATLGLMGEPDAALAVADMTAGAVQEAASSDKPPKPLNERERKKFSPESLGLIAFGLSLLGGADIEDAMAMGMNTYNMVEDKRSAKAQSEAVDAFIKKQSPEDQELLRLLGDDAQAVANFAMQDQQADRELSRKLGLIEQVAAQTGAEPESLAALDTSALQTALTDALFEDAKDKDGKEFTTKQQEAAFAAMEMEGALADIFKAVDDGYDPNALGSGVLRGPLNSLKSPERRTYEAAFDRFFTAFVPYKSGKTFTTQEIEQYKRAYMPSAGAGMNDVNQRKLQALMTLVQQVADSSGGAYGAIKGNTTPAALALPGVPTIGAEDDDDDDNPFGVIPPGGQ